MLIGAIAIFSISVIGQSVHPEPKAVTGNETSLNLVMGPGPFLYVDSIGGMTADQAVAYALEHNGEFLAMKSEVNAASALVKQAGLKANPMFEVNGSKQINGADNTLMASVSLPLELGGRRNARVSVAERELEMREEMLADKERVLSADVRSKFGVALAQVYKLGLLEDQLVSADRGYELVAARVADGSAAPLDRNMVLVEVNRLKSMREANAGKVDIAMLELRNAVGKGPEEPLKLRGSFDELIGQLPPMAESIEQALKSRPDLQYARSAVRLAEAQIEQARIEAKPDATVSAGYQRMATGFPLNGLNNQGSLMPIMSTFQSLTFGVSVSLPVRNKNQGNIEATIAAADAAKQRAQFMELTVRREVASAYAKYSSAARAMEIFRTGVQDQSKGNLTAVKRTYELGARTLIDYLTEQRRFIETESGFIDTVLETYQARVDVDRTAVEKGLNKR